MLLSEPQRKDVCSRKTRVRILCLGPKESILFAMICDYNGHVKVQNLMAGWVRAQHTGTACLPEVPSTMAAQLKSDISCARRCNEHIMYEQLPGKRGLMQMSS